MSISCAGYSKLNQRQKLVTAGETLKNLLRDTQSRAFNGEIDCSPGKCTCSLGSSQSLVGWYADFTGKEIYGKCYRNAELAEFGNKPFGLSDEIGITVVSPVVTSILFTFNPPSVDNDSTICLNLENNANLFYVIKVNKAGTVNDAGDLKDTCSYP